MSKPWVSLQSLLNTIEEKYQNQEFANALRIAFSIHGSQRRDDGTPYLEEHIYPVAIDVYRYTVDLGWDRHDILKATTAAILHDVLEDCPNELWDQTIVKVKELPAYSTVKMLTKSKAGKTDLLTREYIQVIKNDRFARVVKAFDRLNNMRCVQTSSPKKMERYCLETLYYYRPLFQMLERGDEVRKEIEELISAGLYESTVKLNQL